MNVELASAPSGAAVGLIVGCATVTIAAMWGALGWAARRFLAQQTANHADTLEALGIARDIKGELPRLGYRLTRLEIGAMLASAAAAWYAYRRKP